MALTLFGLQEDLGSRNQIEPTFPTERKGGIRIEKWNLQRAQDCSSRKYSATNPEIVLNLTALNRGYPVYMTRLEFVYSRGKIPKK